MPLVEMFRNLWTRVKNLRKKKRRKDEVDRGESTSQEKPPVLVPVRRRRRILKISNPVNKEQYISEIDRIVEDINELIRKLEEFETTRVDDLR